MALLRIRKFPDDVLKAPAAAVKNINGNVEGLIDSMVQTMYAAPGVGLAAPQVGESKRIVVLDTDHDDPGKHLLKLINPQIVESEGNIIWEEGCLSVIDYTAEVERAGAKGHLEQHRMKSKASTTQPLRQHGSPHINTLIIIRVGFAINEE